MAEGTRGSVKGQQEGLQKQQEIIQKQLEQHHQAISGISERLDQLTDMLRSVVESSHVNNQEVRGGNGDDRSAVWRGLRLEFPRFNGTDPNGCVFKATQYFDYHQTPFHQKLLVASYHMEGEALIWYQEGLDSGQFNSWESLILALQVRFGPSAYDDPMEALMKLKQTSSVTLYKSQFEALSNRLKGLSEKHKLSCFLSGLKDEVRLPVKMFNPVNLGAAFGLAKIQEEYILSSRRHWKTNLNLGEKGVVDNAVEVSNRGPRNQILAKRVTSLQMDEKRKKGLCYHCDEKWNPNHICKNPKVYLLHVDSSVDNEETQVNGELVPEVNSVLEKESEELEVSISVISGCTNSNAMKLLGKIGSFFVEILVDSGSTHNFLDPLVVEAAKLKVLKDRGLQVKVANGAKILSQSRCEENISIQGTKFLVPFHVLNLGGCDIVLGVQWLKTLGAIHWDFTKMIMQFVVEGKKLSLQGLVYDSVAVQPGLNLLKSSFVRQQGWLLQIMTLDTCVVEGQVQSEVEQLLGLFKGIFEEPVCLPPPREFDHQILLKEGAQPVSVRPYQYAHYQKAEIEKIVNELLSN
ncbi:hypothetical protein F2P56_032901 [Juglans regia]|uniref:Retrotransposon gag domain-containing protein n=2 Tax=Juglans regia TaxID=51240 RepID=A0A833TZL3_JUGRE|nr:uncharacterized protein LOC109014029 [Juglans regia]KAF5447343.1 hypothetical protein F2P56_032901 [Juglans regia]